MLTHDVRARQRPDEYFDKQTCRPGNIGVVRTDGREIVVARLPLQQHYTGHPP